MDYAMITATHDETGQQHTVDLEGLTLSDLCDELRELFPPQTDDDDQDDAHADPEDVPVRVTLSDPEGFAVHLFSPERGTQGKGPLEPVANFDDILKAWSEESDDDRREAMADYLNNGADDLSDFDEAYQGQHASGAAFAEQLADDLGAVSEDTARWICIDWEATWKSNLRHDYWISDNGHVFRNL